MSDKERLVYLPLGGAGEIGMNMYLYGYGAPGKERWIMVDAGVTFPNMDTTPGVDLIMADPKYAVERADQLEGLFITHAHEDHVGAVGILHEKIRCPIWARRFTALIARNKMERVGGDIERINVAPAYPESIEVGPFKVSFVPISHSIPEASGLLIETPAGKIFHSGDFKIDRDPVIGDPWDEEMFRQIGEGGIKALVCDSTNVFGQEPGRSESTLKPHVTDLIKSAQGMVVATTFASNIARLKTLAQAGVDAGRKVVMLGRAMNVMLDAGRRSNIVTDFPPLTDVDDAENIPRGQLMLLVTGSQGERRAASAQLARGKYMGLSLDEGDMFLFSSKTIPGNELGVAYIKNQLSELGVHSYGDGDTRYHVSGHANRPDIEKLQDILQPQIVVPMHGEHRHLREHAEISADKGRQGIIAPNGTMVDLTGDKGKIVDGIETGRTYLDGDVLIGAMDGVVRQRLQMALRGLVVVNLVIDEQGAPVDGVWAELHGVPMPSGKPLAEELESEIEDAMQSAKGKKLRSDDAVESLVVKTVNRVVKDRTGKKPLIEVMINRMMFD
ncbi:ribonuclease J [Paracoccaceae bacterium GXU_MW_L88]